MFRCHTYRHTYIHVFFCLVCMYVCMHGSTIWCMTISTCSSSVFIQTHIHKQTNMCRFVMQLLHQRMHTYTPTCSYSVCIHTNIHTQINMCRFLASARACIHTYMCISVCIHTHLHVYQRVHTYTHTHR
jgi:hypothetical protein